MSYITSLLESERLFEESFSEICEDDDIVIVFNEVSEIVDEITYLEFTKNKSIYRIIEKL